MIEEKKIKEIAKRLAKPVASAESADQLKNLLDNLAQDNDFESLPDISAHIRDQFEAGRLQGIGPAFLKEKSRSLIKIWSRYGLVQRAAIVGSLLVVLVVVVAALGVVSMLASSGKSGGLADSPRSETPVAEVGEKPQDAPQTQSVLEEATPTQVTPVEAAPKLATPTESPSPTPSQKEYIILACVTWQDDQAVGLPGSRIIWQVGEDEASREEIDVTREDGCVQFSVSALPNTSVTLTANPPQDDANLHVVGHAENVDNQTVDWEAVKEGEPFSLGTRLGEETSAEYSVRFLVVAERTLAGRVVTDNGGGIPGAEVQLWTRRGTGSDSQWSLITKTTTADTTGTFVFTDTTGSPRVFYRMGVTHAVGNRYVYAMESASGPNDDWVSKPAPQAGPVGPALPGSRGMGEDPLIEAISLIETQTALGPDQLAVQDIVFSQKLEYVLLSVQDAILEPEGLDWQTVSAPSGQDEVVSKLIAIDQTNVDTLQARWENVELPPGTYALEIWTPGDTSARVSYAVLSAGRLLDERVSYQSTRQTKGEVNQWMDFSKTLNPSLLIELPAAGQVTVIARPSLRGDNRDFNLSGNVLFGVGPVRLAKQQ